MQDLEKQVFTGRICDVRYFFTFTGSICVDLQEEEVKEHFTSSKHCSTVIYNPRKSTKRSIDILLEVLASYLVHEFHAFESQRTRDTHPVQ